MGAGHGCVESFSGKLRHELLNGEILSTLQEAKVLIEMWRKHYNRVRRTVRWAIARLPLRGSLPGHPALR